MDGQEQARIIGLAMVRGLVSIETLREAASADHPCLLDALMSQGVLDEIDVQVLKGIPDSQGGIEPGRGSSPGLDATPGSWPDAGPVWRDLPDLSALSVEDGRRVRESFTLSHWKKYQDLQFVAEGGLGRIFKAFDPRLKRTVALKFLRRDDPELLRRFELEAQHQARVEHPNICKVFEVGEWKGQAYIAMQYIQGETLEAAAPSMNLDEKVETLEIVAEALHAAHRQGLTHRDIKPANIMIERFEGTQPKPYVLDFGLAKDIESSGLTLQGMVIGTMHYMAPEQAKGQFDRIGRRTDVYGLGATLYKMLTGRMVFQGTDGLDSARKTVEEEPESPRRWVPGLPKDLETIVLKCLEKEPERRYESALALAEDLRRFREGEPILARPASWSYRAGKYARKHRLVVALSSAALASVLLMASWGISVSVRARRVSGFAASFSAEAEDMATSLRMAYLLPRHDIRPQQASVRNRMERIRQIIRKEGKVAEGPGAYALGQGYLVLREFTEARRELEAAWSKGYRNSQVALALGQTLGELYREGWEELPQIGDLDQREARKRELARQFREPALAYLKQGANEKPERKTYMEGLLAYYGEQYAIAISKARDAFGQEPTLYEAKQLEGNALVAMGLAEQDADPAACLQHLREAEEPYTVALNMARSDPALISAEGRRQGEMARYAFFYAANPEDNYANVQANLDQVFAVDPDTAHVYLTKSRLAGAYAVYLAEHGQDPFPALEQATQWAERATRLTEGELFVSSSLGEFYRLKAVYQRERGQDPAEALETAFRFFQEAISLRPGDAWIHQRLAETCAMRGDLAIERGEDPQPILNRGLFHTKESLRLAGSSSTAMSGANLHCSLGDWKRDHGRDPVPSYRQSLDYYQMAIRKSPDDGDLYAGVADITVRYATHLLQVGEPAEGMVQQGLEASAKSVKLQATYLHLLNQGDCMRVKALLQIARGEDPAISIRSAEDSLRRSERLNPSGDYTLYWYQGLLVLATGQGEELRHRSPEPAWSHAQSLLAKASKMNPKALEPWVAMARLAWLQGRWQRSQHMPMAVIPMGLTATMQGFSLKSRQPELQALRGCLFMLQAEASVDGAKRARLLGQARHDLESALEENRFLSREFAPELDKVKTRLTLNNG